MKRHIDKCLTHHLRTPDGVRRLYILPYEGNLTDRKFEQLAKRLKASVGHHYPDSPLSEYVPRLKSEWLTGRNQDVTISQDDSGSHTIKGAGWMMFGIPAGDFAILDEEPVSVG